MPGHAPERNVRLVIAYDGTSFRGWAAQGDPSIRTVEGLLTSRLSAVLRHGVKLQVAGRTDAGVHARAQVANFRTSSAISAGRIQSALNSLSTDVSVISADEAPPTFDARFSASAREYKYRIRIGDVGDPFTGNFEWHRPGALSVSSMRAAARMFVGENDFASFCRHPGHGKSTVRRLEKLTIKQEAGLLVMTFKANAFLHQMVRALTGTLVVVGDGKLEPNKAGELLAARDRKGTADLAPAKGLTLERVYYRRRDHR